MSAQDPTAATSPAPSALSPLRFPVFRNVWLASMASNLGGLIQSVGAAWLMLSLAGSPDMVALVQASVNLPIMLLSLLAGAMADSLDRRKLMLAAQGFMLIMSVLLAVFAFGGWISPWLLLTCTFLIGCGGAFNAPAWQASVGDMVPRPELPGAVALNGMGFNLARSVGPALGGAIVAAAGAATAFTINALSFVGLMVVLARWRPSTVVRLLPRETLGTAIVAGIRYVSMSPAIRVVLVRGAAFGLAASAVLALMPVVAKDLLGGGALTYGLLLGGFGVGAVAGGMVAATLRRSWTTERIVSTASAAFAIAAIMAGASTMLWLTMVLLLVAGAGWVLALSTFNVSVQLAAPRWVVARALSLYQMAAFGGLAAGSWLWGEVATQADVSVALWIAGALLLAATGFARVLPLEQSEARDLDPLRQWDAPPTAVPVDSRTGPVVVSIEYRIRAEDILEFLAAMAERRRIRRRDGARHWTLLRDLADAELWIERYETPTWLDYIRHNNRITKDDAEIPERLRALHRGTERPTVRRMIERQTSALPTQRITPELAEPITDGTSSS